MQKSFDFVAYLENIKSINPSFDEGVLKVAYYGTNRNNSNITKDAFEDAILSLYNVPIVVNYKKAEDKLGGHDGHIEKTLDGESVQYIHDTQPIGVVPTGANTWWEKVKENGKEHEYFCVNVVLWKRQEAYAKLRKLGKINHSMEIDVLESHWDKRTEVIDKFIFTALCLLDESITPCFESSKLHLYTLNKEEFKQEFSQMVNELRTTTEAISWLNWGNEAPDNVLIEEQVEDDIVVVVSEIFETEKGGKEVDREKLEMALSEPKFALRGGLQKNKYTMFGCHEKSVFAIDMEDQKVKKMAYSIEEEEVAAEEEGGEAQKTEKYVIDFESAEEGKFNATFAIASEDSESAEEEIIEIIAEGIARLMGIGDLEDAFERMLASDSQLLAVSSEFEAKSIAKEAEFAELKEKFESLNAEFAKIEKEKAEKEKDEKEAEVEKAFAEVSKVLDKEDIDAWREKAKTIEDADAFILEMKMFALDVVVKNPDKKKFSRMGLTGEEETEKDNTTHWERLQARANKTNY